MGQTPQVMSTSVPVHLSINSGSAVCAEVDMNAISAPFGRFSVNNDIVDVDTLWKNDLHSSMRFFGNKQRWADISSSGRPSSDIGDPPTPDTGSLASSPRAPGKACSKDSDFLPRRPSMLGQFQCFGFNTASTDDAFDADTHVPMCVAESASHEGDLVRHRSSSLRKSSLGAFATMPTITDEPLSPPFEQCKVNGFVDGVNNPGIQLRISVPIDENAVVDGAGKLGYAGLVSLCNIGGPDSLTGRRSSPFIEAVCTGAINHPDAVKRLVRSVANGLRAQQDPEAAREGMGGSYFLRSDDGRMSAIFKPCDEEPLAPNNPKGWAGRAMGAPGMKPSVRVGEAAFREVAAYLLDHDGFAGVPPAVLAKCWHPALNFKVRVTKIESLMDISQLNSAAGGQSPKTGPSMVVAAARQSSCASAEDASTTSSTPIPVAEGQGTSFERPLKPFASGLAQALVRDEMSRNLTPGSSGSATSDMKASASSGGLRGLQRPPPQSKVGSLQQYVAHTCDANDISPSRFSASNVHRIGILDIRILNCDRHAGNLLVGKPKRDSTAASHAAGRLQQDMLQLVPIDHGFSLPEALDNPYFEWLYWPQASLPFGKAELDYIAKLNVQEDIAMLRRFIPLLREECLRCLEVTTTVLQMCAAAGLTLFEIGSIMTRTDTLGEQLPSDLEVMCMDAREEALSTPANPALSQTSCSGIMSPTSAQNSMLSTGVALPAWDEEDEDSIFQLEGDNSGMQPSRKTSSGQASGALGMSDDSFTGMLGSPVSPFESPQYSATTLQQHSLPGCHTVPSALRLFQRPTCVTPPPPPMPELPRSVSSFAGGVESDLPRSRHKHVERRMWRHKQRARNAKRAPYPPLIAGDHPDLVNYVFSGLSASQWRVFMNAVRDWISEELSNQTWKQSIANTAVAGSCPMFSRV